MAHLAIAAAGIALLGITILRHEMWRDELQAWQIARGSHGLHNLIHNTRYEGHPLLWFAVLYPLAHAHAGPGAMQLFQFFVASTTIAVSVWRAPFTTLQKGLMVFGYFVLYEYGVLTRSYGLGAMFIVITCAVAATPGRRRWPIIGILLALAALTSAFGAVVAVAVLAGLFVDEQVRRRHRLESASTPSTVGTGIALVLAGLAIAYLQAGRPPADTGSYNHWRTHLDVGLGASSVSAIWRAIVPIPELKHTYWNTNIITARAAVLGVLGLVLFVVITYLFRDRPGSFTVWVGGTVLVVGFLYARIGTATASRHIGHIFLCLFAAMWLAPTMEARHTRSRAPRERPEIPRLRSRAWTVLLVVQVIAGLFAVSLDLVYPFSNGRNVASYIRREHMEHLEIIGMPDTASSTVAGYLDRTIYYVAGARDGTFVVWNAARNQSQPLESVVSDPTTSGTAAGGDARALVLLNHPLNDPNLHLTLLKHFENGIVGDEHYWLYLGTAKSSP